MTRQVDAVRVRRRRFVLMNVMKLEQLLRLLGMEERRATADDKGFKMESS
jgi:hypothetical protein